MAECNHKIGLVVNQRILFYRRVNVNMIPKKLTRVAAPSPRASLGRRTVCGRTELCRPPVSKRYETKVRMVWGSFIIAAAALKTPTRNCYNAQGVNLTFLSSFSRWYGECNHKIGLVPQSYLVEMETAPQVIYIYIYIYTSC